MLLFGEVLGETPDPFPFWHSSQVKDPGLNLAVYESNKADNLLEAARVNLDPDIRAEKYQQFQDILIDDVPCIFLYRPDYVYFVDKKIKGGLDIDMIVDPSKRFSEIENWYTKQKRSW
jgi:peptide/nickel transport system substrate-binding protein